MQGQGRKLVDSSNCNSLHVHSISRRARNNCDSNIDPCASRRAAEEIKFINKLDKAEPHARKRISIHGAGGVKTDYVHPNAGTTLGGEVQLKTTDCHGEIQEAITARAEASREAGRESVEAMNTDQRTSTSCVHDRNVNYNTFLRPDQTPDGGHNVTDSTRHVQTEEASLRVTM